VNPAHRQAIAQPLAHFLKVLHAIPAADALKNGATGDTIARGNIRIRQPKALSLLEKTTQAGLVQNAATLQSIIESAPVSRQLRADTLCHGDLYCRHLLIEDGKLSGVIDWGDVHVGDPAIDLALAWTFTPEDRAVFLDTYGVVDAQTLSASRFRATHHALVVVLYANEIADEDLQREQQLALRNIGTD
jgi:aminoglycoside phosphotransferase (APT) family kinase protein